MFPVIQHFSRTARFSSAAAYDDREETSRWRYQGETTFSFSLARGRVLLLLDLEMGSSLIIISLSICVRPPLMMLPAGHASEVLNAMVNGSLLEFSPRDKLALRNSVGWKRKEG